MFMFVPSFLFCDPPGVLGLDNLLGYLLEAMGEVPSACRFQPVLLTRPDASLGTISTSFRSHVRKREATAGIISPPLSQSTFPEAFPLAATQEDQGEQDGMKQRAYPVPGCTCSWNASGIKMLEKREDHEGGFHPCDKTRQGTGGNNETP
jgi:hypothetical protein